MQRTIALAAMLAAFGTAYLFGGGWFVISIGQPGAHSDPRAHTSAFVVQVYGCAAGAARVVATAEGVVNGRRQSIRLQPIRLSGDSAGRFAAGTGTVAEWPHFSVAVPRSWPAEGTWIVRVTADTGGLSRSALVAVAPSGGVDWGRTRLADSFVDREVDAALRGPSDSL